MKPGKKQLSTSKVPCRKERVSDKASAAEKAQSAVDQFCRENNIEIDEIKAMLGEHL